MITFNYIVTMKISERVKLCRQALSLTQPQVAELLSVSQPAYQRLEKGGVKNPKMLHKLAEIFQTTPQWLQYGVGKSPEYLKMVSIPEGKVPILAWEQVVKWVANPSLESLLKENSFAVGKSRVGEPLVKIDFTYFPEKSSDKVFALRVKDDSMISTIPGRRTFLEGDIIIVDPDRTPRNMSFVICTINDAEEPIFKQLIVDGNNQFLRPLNTQYPLIPFDKDKIKICGVVILGHMDVLI